MLSSYITHTLDPYHRTNRKSTMRSKGCVLCSYSIPTLFQYFFYDHIPTFLYIFHEMFFITCLYAFFLAFAHHKFHLVYLVIGYCKP